MTMAICQLLRVRLQYLDCIGNGDSSLASPTYTCNMYDDDDGTIRDNFDLVYISSE